MDADAASGFEILRELADQRLVSLLVLAVNDVRKKNYIVAPWDRILPIVAGDQLDARRHAGFTDEFLGDVERCRKIEDGCAHLVEAAAQKDGVGRRAGTDIEQVGHVAPVNSLSEKLAIATGFDQGVHAIDKGFGFFTLLLIHVCWPY